MPPVPAVVAPLVWLLVFVFGCALVYGVVRYFEFEIHPKLERLAVGLIALICIVVILFWVLGLLGWGPAVHNR